MEVEICSDSVGPRYAKYKKYFTFNGMTGTKIKKDAPKEAIRLYLREIADGALDCEELENAETLTNYMIDKFKRLEIYNLKTEEERAEIIEEIRKNPEPEKFEFFDDDGKPMKVKGASFNK